MKKKAKKYLILIVVAIVVLLITSFIIYKYQPKSKDGISIYAIYDRAGNEIKPTKITQQTAFGIPSESIIYYGAYSVAFSITITNNEEEFPLDFIVESATPNEFGTALANVGTMNLAAGETDTWISDTILLEGFVVPGVTTPVDFYIKVKAVQPEGKRRDDFREWTLSTTIAEDPLAAFSFVVTLHGLESSLPIGWWKFDGNLFDSSGNSNTAINHGATLVSGIKNQAYEFDGFNDYIDCGSSINSDIVDDFTISLWVKPQSNQEYCYDGIEGNYAVAGSADAAEGTNTWSWQLRYGSPDACSLGLQVNTITGSKWANVGYNLVANEWTHIVATFTGTEEKIYVNDNLVDTNTFSSTTIRTYINNKVLLGNAGWGESNTYFNGAIDDVQIYDRVLTASEVAAL